MIRITRRTALAGLAAAGLAPAMARAANIGSITRFDSALDAILDAKAPIEVLGTGYRWAEGPAWMPRDNCLFFSDVPANIAYRWKEGEGVTPFLDPSGLAGPIPAGIREAGSNGLAVDEWGDLIMADSGSRAIARVFTSTNETAKQLLATQFEGKRFNSCNDLALSRSGAIYFTDPPYGLAEGDTSPLKELGFNGVFRRSASGALTLLDRSLSRPNGIALSADESRLYVAVSDPAQPQVLVYDLSPQGTVSNRRVFADFAAEVAKKLPGLPDGLKVAKSGHVFATGPGGVHVLSPEGKRLGLIATGKAIANCAFGGADGKTLFLTSSDMLCRVPLAASGW